MFLNLKNLEKASDLPKNIIGSTKATFYRNLVEHRLIDDQTGEPIPEALEKLEAQRDAQLT